LYEDLSAELLKQGKVLLSFEFYILAGRFNIQYILEVYFPVLMKFRTSGTRAIAGFLTSGVIKFVEQSVPKNDVILLFICYVFLHMLD